MAKEILPDNSLYIPMTDVKDKRRSLLLTLKDTLVLQEEYEKLISTRFEKKEILKEIKKKMDSINAHYQDLKRVLPNIKTTISTTEKEINHLEKQLESLKLSGKNAREVKELEKEIGEKKEAIKTNHPTPENKEKTIHIPKKIDRVKNNLRIIESKLSKL